MAQRAAGPVAVAISVAAAEATSAAAEEEISVAAVSRSIILGVALAFALVAPAGAQVQEVAKALTSDPVYVDPDAELAGQVDADALRARIKSAGATPTFIAVLPASAANGSAGRTLVSLRTAVGRKGTYALALGREFRTFSDGFDAAPAGTSARSAHPDNLQDALVAFIDTTGKQKDDAGSGGSGAGALIALLLLVAARGRGSLPADQPPPEPRRRARRPVRGRPDQPAGRLRAPR